MISLILQVWKMAIESLLGIPLVGKLFIPILAIAAIVFLLAFGITRWTKYNVIGLKKSEVIADVITKDSQPENNKPINEVSNGEVLTKKKKKKKSCCSTKGACCKTKKESVSKFC
jgi:hypothetical protein